MSRRNAERIGNAGVAIVDEIVNLQLGWIFRREDAAGTDHGVDAQIEVVDDEGTATGHLLAAQIKTGKKYLKPTTGDAFTFYGETRHLPYWLGHSLPVLIILVDENSRTAYWQVVREPLQRTKKRWKLAVPRANTVGTESKDTLAELAHEHARAARAAREGQPTEELTRRAEALDTEMGDLVPPLQPSRPLTEAPPELDVDVLRLPFRKLIAWTEKADFTHITIPETSRSVYVVAAEHLFFRTEISEHDAAKAFVLLMLAREYGKAGSIFLHFVEILRVQKRVSEPSLLDLRATTPLPDVMPLDLRLVMRITHISARRKHGRPTEALEDELEQLVAQAGQAEAWALTAAAFYEARWNGSRNPQRALSYVAKAGTLRPGAQGYEGLPFPSSLDATWRLTLELTMYGVRFEHDIEQWLTALSAIPAPARDNLLADEMNCLTIANRLWLEEVRKNPPDRDWRTVHRASATIERWSEANEAALLFAAARRARVIVRGEYEHELQEAVRMASDVPPFVTADPRAKFILDEIVASQFVYARKYAEADVAFRLALEGSDSDSSLLSRTYLKAAQAAAAIGRHERAVDFATRAIDAVDADRFRTHTDRPLAYAELALAHWFNGDRTASIEAWNRAGEELFAAERDDEQWHGLLVRFHYVGGYFATILHKGSPPPYDAGGNRFIEPKPGAFLIELDTQAAASNLSVRIAAFLILAMMADVQSNDQRVRRWSYAALEAAARKGEFRTEIGLFAIPPLIADGRFRDAADLQSAMTRRALGEGATFDPNELAASFVVIPAFLRIAAAKSGQVDFANALHDVCREEAASTNAKIWHDCADVIHTAFLTDSNLDDRLLRLRSIAQAQQSGTEAAGLIASIVGIGASIQPGLPLTTSLAYQSGVQSEIVDRLQHFKTVFRQFVIPFFSSFWLVKLESNPDAFRQSDLLKARLEEANAIVAPDTPRAILAHVARHIDLDA